MLYNFVGRQYGTNFVLKQRTLAKIRFLFITLHFTNKVLY